MNKHSDSEEKTFDKALAAYTDALINHRPSPPLNKTTGAAIANLTKTVSDFYSLAISIKPDDTLKASILKKMHSEWESHPDSKRQIKSPWYHAIVKIFEQPTFRRVAIPIVVVFLIVSGVLYITLSRQPGPQVLQGTAESLKNGLIIGVFVLAALILIWMFIKDKK